MSAPSARRRAEMPEEVGVLQVGVSEDSERVSLDFWVGSEARFHMELTPEKAEHLLLLRVMGEAVANGQRAIFSAE